MNEDVGEPQEPLNFNYFSVMCPQDVGRRIRTLRDDASQVDGWSGVDEHFRDAHYRRYRLWAASHGEEEIFIRHMMACAIKFNQMKPYQPPTAS